MERLNNIMRTVQRSYQPADQDMPSAQGQRVPARRLPPESSTRPNRAGYTRPTPSARLPEEQWEGTPPPRAPLHRTNYSGPRTVRESGRAAEQPMQRARYAEQPPQGDYYEDEEHVTIVPADVQEEWGDDTAGMRYGDWEDEAGYNHAFLGEQPEDYTASVTRPQAPRTSAQEISAVAQRLAQVHNRNNPLATRQLYRVTPDQPRTTQRREARDTSERYRVPSEQMPREVHETRLPIPASGSQLAPSQPGTGARSPQRNTQPLKSQQLARLPAEARGLRSQRPILPQTPRQAEADYTITLKGTLAPGACPICHGAGFLRSNVEPGHPHFGKPVACQCKEQERKRKRRQQLHELSNLGIFANKRFESFNSRVPGVQEAYNVSVKFASDPDGWLLFIGPNGCGKTHLAAAIANECLEAGSVVLFATVPDLLDHLRAAFMPDSDEVYDQLFARMREAEVLVLDDLGTQQSSPWANEKLFQLLNYRYNSGFPTVITANPKGLQATDERIRSRLSDTSLVYTLNLDRARDFRPHNPRRE